MSESRTILEKGKAWLELGFSIIPCGLNKKPYAKWESFQDRQPTVEEVESWCRTWPGLQWGIVTGPISNLLVVDADSPQAAAAIKALLPDPQAVITVQTCNDGHEQFWFECDLDVPQTQAITENLPPDQWIDIRNLGGYTMAPGSAAYKKNAQGVPITTTGTYRFAAKVTLESIRNRGKIPPDLKAHLLKSRPLNVNGSAPPPVFPIIKEGDKVPHQTRDNYLFNKALKLIDAGMPRPLVENDIAILVRDYCEPGDLPDPQKKVQAAYAYRAKNPLGAPLNVREPEKQGAAEEPQKYDLSKILMTGSAIQLLDIRVEWVLDKLIPENALTLLHGPGGIGKTWLALAIAKAVSAGVPFLGQATKKKQVCYIDFENPWPVLHDRICALNISDTLFWHLSFSPRPPKLDVEDWQIYKAMPPESLLIFDTTRSSHSGKGNDDDIAAFVMGNLKQVREAGHSILLLDHTPRANERTSKGSGAWTDLADQVLAFYRVQRGTFEEIVEEGFDPNALLHFGTGHKSRYERFKLFVTLNPKTGDYTIAVDPNVDIIAALSEYIAGPGYDQNQTQIVAWTKDNPDTGKKSKQAIKALLARGISENLWHTVKGDKNSQLHRPGRKPDDQLLS